MIKKARVARELQNPKAHRTRPRKKAGIGKPVNKDPDLPNQIQNPDLPQETADRGSK